MSNPSGLPVTGVQYVIDASTVNNQTNIILLAQGRIDASTRQLAQRSESLDRAFGANSRSVRQFTSELVSLAGGGSQATGIITGLLAAASPLDVALVGVGGAVLGAKAIIDAATTSFEAHQQSIANTTLSYDELYRSRLQALRTPEGVVGGGLPGTVDAIQKTFGQILQDALTRGPQSPAELINRFFSLELQNFQKGQQKAATDNFVVGAQNRALADNLQREIQALQLQGKSYDELVPKVYAYINALKAIGRAEGSGVGGAITGTDVQAFISASFPSKALSVTASKLGADILAAQSQYQASAAESYRQHQTALQNIAISGAQQRQRIDRSFAEGNAAINEQLAEADAGAAERRADLAEQYAAERIAIEQRYQEQVARVNETYGTSLFDAVRRFDALGVLRAQAEKRKGLQEASRTRDQDNNNAEKKQAEAQRNLDDSLAKQRASIQKQRERLRQNYADQLSDLNQSQAQQRAAENRSYAERTKQLAAAFAARKAQLVAALVAEQGISEKYARAIIDSLKGILDPKTIKELTDNLTKALDATVHVTVTSNAPQGSGGVSVSGRDARAYAFGGYDPTGGLRMLHPDEWVIPSPSYAGIARTSEVLDRAIRHYSAPVRAVMGGGNARVMVDLNVNSPLLSARITQGANNAIVRVNRDAARP